MSMQGLTVAGLADEGFQTMAENFPEMAYVAVPELNWELDAIDGVYPYKFPLWGIMALTVLAAVLVMVCVTVVVACGHGGRCGVEWCFTESSGRARAFRTVRYKPPSKQDLKTRNSIASSCKSGKVEIQMRGLVPGRGPAETALTPVAPSCVGDILQGDCNMDFTRCDRVMEVVWIRVDMHHINFTKSLF